MTAFHTAYCKVCKEKTLHRNSFCQKCEKENNRPTGITKVGISFNQNVSKCPSELEPVLAKIEHISSLGKSSWYEVVYFDGNWRCYAGSKTFKDGEKVIKWRYCKDCY